MPLALPAETNRSRLPALVTSVSPLHSPKASNATAFMDAIASRGMLDGRGSQQLEPGKPFNAATESKRVQHARLVRVQPHRLPFSTGRS